MYPIVIIGAKGSPSGSNNGKRTVSRYALPSLHKLEAVDPLPHQQQRTMVEHMVQAQLLLTQVQQSHW